MHRTLHPKDNIDRLYVLKKEERRGLLSTEDTVDASIRRPEDYIIKNKEKLITVTQNSTDNEKINLTTLTRK